MEIVVIIFFVLILIGGIIFIVFVKKKNEKQQHVPIIDANADPSCCGAHEVCEFDLIKINPDIIEYFEDEELDKYKGLSEDFISDEIIDEFREVLYTLQKHEINNWLLSLSRRGITLPAILQAEARDLIAES